MIKINDRFDYIEKMVTDLNEPTLQIRTVSEIATERLREEKTAREELAKLEAVMEPTPTEKALMAPPPTEEEPSGDMSQEELDDLFKFVMSKGGIGTHRSSRRRRTTKRRR